MAASTHSVVGIAVGNELQLGMRGLHELHLLRLPALLARAHGDAPAYAHFRDRLRQMARTREFSGHIAWA